jgi:hypothetical protein
MLQRALVYICEVVYLFATSLHLDGVQVERGNLRFDVEGTLGVIFGRGE